MAGLIMNLKALKKIEIEDVKTARMFENLNEFLNQLMPNQFISGNAVNTIRNNLGKEIPIVLSSTTTLVPHGLGVEYTGFYVTYSNAGQTVYVDDTLTNTGPGQLNSSTKFIPLKATGTVTVKLWVF
jgi:hypothetical protein